MPPEPAPQMSMLGMVAGQVEVGALVVEVVVRVVVRRVVVGVVVPAQEEPAPEKARRQVAALQWAGVLSHQPYCEQQLPGAQTWLAYWGPQF